MNLDGAFRIALSAVSAMRRQIQTKSPLLYCHRGLISSRPDVLWPGAIGRRAMYSSCDTCLGPGRFYPSREAQVDEKVAQLSQGWDLGSWIVCR